MEPPNLGEHLPRYYDDIRETDELIRIENTLFGAVKDEMTAILRNQFILECDEVMLAVWENLLGIHFDARFDINEDFQLRRYRLINRLIQRPPFTYLFLRKRLDAIVAGLDGQASTGYEYELAIDYENYVLHLKSAVENRALYNEMILTIYRAKPANLAFNLIPELTPQVEVSTRGYTSGLKQKRLGQWRLGETAFEYLGGFEPIKSWDVAQKMD